MDAQAEIARVSLLVPTPAVEADLPTLPVEIVGVEVADDAGQIEAQCEVISTPR